MPFAHNIGQGVLPKPRDPRFAQGRLQGGLEGAVSDMGRQLRQFGLAGIVLEEFVDVPAADTDAFLLAAAVTDAIQVYEAADLDGDIGADALSHPRNVTVTTLGADDQFVFPLTVDVEGTLDGAVQTETITLAAGDSPGTKAGTKPFDKVTKLTISAGPDPSTGTIAVGFGSGIGLSHLPISRAGLRAPIREIAAGSAVTNGAFNANRLYTPNTVPDGSNDYAVYYEADVNSSNPVLEAARPTHQRFRQGVLRGLQAIGLLVELTSKLRLFGCTRHPDQVTQVTVQAALHQAHPRQIHPAHPGDVGGIAAPGQPAAGPGDPARPAAGPLAPRLRGSACGPWRPAVARPASSCRAHRCGSSCPPVLRGAAGTG